MAGDDMKILLELNVNYVVQHKLFHIFFSNFLGFLGPVINSFAEIVPSSGTMCNNTNSN